MIQSTVHCDEGACHHWAPYDEDSDDELPRGWVGTVIAQRRFQFCSLGHAGAFLDRRAAVGARQ